MNDKAAALLPVDFLLPSLLLVQSCSTSQAVDDSHKEIESTIHTQFVETNKFLNLLVSERFTVVKDLHLSNQCLDLLTLMLNKCRVGNPTVSISLEPASVEGCSRSSSP